MAEKTSAGRKLKQVRSDLTDARLKIVELEQGLARAHDANANQYAIGFIHGLKAAAAEPNMEAVKALAAKGEAKLRQAQGITVHNEGNAKVVTITGGQDEDPSQA